MKLVNAQRFFDQNDAVWTLLGAWFADIAHRGNMDELGLVAKGLDLLIERAQQEISLRN